MLINESLYRWKVQRLTQLVLVKTFWKFKYLTWKKFIKIDPYLIVKDGQLAGMGEYSYTKGSATGGSEEAAKYKK